MKYLIICGEISGEKHAYHLIKHLKVIDKESEFSGWGSELLKSENVNIIVNIKEVAVLGVIEIFYKFFKILKNYYKTIKYVKNYKPDLIILIDYPGLNLRFAKVFNKLNFKIIYFIPPSVWAWHKSRIKILKKYVHKIFVILPFEVDFYKNNNLKVEYFGHPLVDIIKDFKKKYNSSLLEEYPFLKNKKIIAAIPGSRTFEVKKMLPLIHKLAREFNHFVFCIPTVKTISRKIYEKYKTENIYFFNNKIYEILSHSYVALVNSGTAVLETALFKVPQIVCYKVNIITFVLGKLLVKVKFISLVNLILNENVVPELIQVKYKKLKKIFSKLITNNELQNRIIKNYEILEKILTGENAYKNIAQKIYEFGKK